MSLLSHCGTTVTTECVCRVIARFPEYTTVGLFFASWVYYDVVFFWLSIEMMISYFINILLNLITHPHDATQVVFGTAGFLGNPSFQAQFCVNTVLVTVMFFHFYRNHVPGWGIGVLFTVIVAVMFATVYLTNESYMSIYTGSLVGAIVAVISFVIYALYLQPLSNDLCFTWFGKLNGFRNSYAKRLELDDPEFHRRVLLMMQVGGYDNIKEMINDLIALNATADEQETDPLYADFGY